MKKKRITRGRGGGYTTQKFIRTIYVRAYEKVRGAPTLALHPGKRTTETPDHYKTLTRCLINYNKYSENDPHDKL